MTSHDDVAHMIQAEMAHQREVQAAIDATRPRQMIRILVYEGDEEWLRTTIPGRAVKGTINVGPGRSIREVYLSEFPMPSPEPSQEATDADPA